jgi:hypothetical protein
MIFQWDSTKLLEDCCPAGLAAMEELLVWRKDLMALPNNFSLQSQRNRQAKEPASVRKAKNAAWISLC